jgi:hypothetical protein
MTLRINPRWRIAHYIRPKYFKNQEKFVRRAARPTPFKEIYFENVVLGLRESESRFALIEAVLVVEMSYTHPKIFGLFFCLYNSIMHRVALSYHCLSRVEAPSFVVFPKRMRRVRK